MPAQADDLVRQLTAAGFLQVQLEIRKAGHRKLVIVHGKKGSAR